MDTGLVVAHGRALHVPEPFGVMGIVNLTPDSFYAESRMCAEQARGYVRKLREEGADIIDVGAESSRPFAKEVPARHELERLLPLVSAVQNVGITLSVDTYHALTANAVLEKGAAIINDISGCLWDPELIDVLVQHKPGYVLMHALDRPERMQHTPQYSDVCACVRSFFEQRLNFLVKAGLPENRIWLDPGIGFGKTCAQNCALLKNIEIFHCFGRPILLGVSMKSFFSDLLQIDLQDRMQPTQVATALLYSKGVFWHRVHHVQDTRRTLRLAASLQI